MARLAGESEADSDGSILIEVLTDTTRDTFSILTGTKRLKGAKHP